MEGFLIVLVLGGLEIQVWVDIFVFGVVYVSWILGDCLSRLFVRLLGIFSQGIFGCFCF